METKTYNIEKFRDIQLKVVPVEKLAKFFNVELAEKDSIYIAPFAVYKDLYCLDTDCCFWETERKYIKGQYVPCIIIEARVKRYDSESKTYSIRMDKNDFATTIPIDDYLTLADDISFVDFVRFNYNPRIISNQNLFLEHLKISSERV